MLSLRSIANTDTIYTGECLEVGSHSLSCLTFTPIAPDKTLHWLPASTLLPPLPTEAKEDEGAQLPSPEQSAALCYF